MPETITIARRFHGPPNSGNGGYACGCVARFITGPAEVMLKAPPPLDAALDVMREDTRILVRHDGRDIAEGRAAEINVTPPAAPSLEDAQAATTHYRGHLSHIFPTCFVCGPNSEDGLRLFCGAIGESGLVAAPWIPSQDLATPSGEVADEFLWAALDCPSYWALPRAGSIAAVLGKLTASIDARPRVGDPLIVAAWPRGADGRKHYSASAIYDAHGNVCARAEAVWIELKPAPQS